MVIDVGNQAAERLPKRWNWFCQGFLRYVKRYCRKHLHAIRISKTSAPIPNDGLPIVIVLNHPGWWDPLVCVTLTELFPGYTHYAAIDSQMLHKYRAFSRLGFFGVDAGSYRGAVNFLRTASSIMAHDRHSLWITSQGEFADVRKRPLGIQSGVGHLATRLSRGYILPLALEYNLWTERTLEVLVRFGEALPLTTCDSDGHVWTTKIEQRLTETLDGLNREVMTRDPKLFTTHISGKTGVGGGYDLFRRLGSWLRGRKFQPSHMDESSETS